MNDPYTLPDEDPFSSESALQYLHEKREKHHRSSLLDSWIKSPCEASDRGLGCSSNPYLAYPDLTRPSSSLPIRQRTHSCASSYDLIEDDDIPAQMDKGKSKSSTSPRSFLSLSLFPFPLTPTKNKFRHSRPASASESVPTLPVATPASPVLTPKRRSVLPRFTLSPSQSHSSISDTLHLPPLQPPRPSFSSSTSSLRLCASSNMNPTMSTTTFDSDSGIGLTETPTKSKSSFFSSLRLRPSANNSSASNLSSTNIEFAASKDTLISRRALSPKRLYPTLSNIPSLSNITDIDNDEDTNIDNLDFLPPPSYRFSRTSSQSSASASSSHIPSSSHLHLPAYSKRDRAYFSSLTSRTGKKKRKLIISGIGATEVRKFDGVKRWCESFGELRSIIRLPNGDLQVDFRDPEVADTVCRVRAKVFIAGVGSVQLSWIVGNKR